MMGGSVETLPRYMHSRVWAVLRPAESALRRLIVVVKQRMKIEVRVVTPRAAMPALGIAPRGERRAVPAFALFDRRKSFDSVLAFGGRRYAKGTPNIRFFDGYDTPVPVKAVAMPDDMISAGRLNRRLAALRNALDDLPKQARRMARVEAKRAALRAQSGKYIRPMRPGRPPGYRARKRHPVDFVLSDCHEMALYLLVPP